VSSAEKEIYKTIKEAGKREMAKSLSKTAPKKSGLRRELLEGILRLLEK